MRWDDEDFGGRGAGRQRERVASGTGGRRPAWWVAALVAGVVVAVGAVAAGLMLRDGAYTQYAANRGGSTPTASLVAHDALWHRVGLSADEQIVFSQSEPQTGYSCGATGNSIAMHVTHDGGMSWQPLALATQIAGEICVLMVDQVNSRHIAVVAVVSKPDPCIAAACTPTPCANACQTCVDYCSPPTVRTISIYQSADGGGTWAKAGALPNGAHFGVEIAFAGSTLYAWTDTWPTLLAASVAGGSFRLIDVGAFYPKPQENQTGYDYLGGQHFWTALGALYLAISGDMNGNRFAVTRDGGVTWTRRSLTMNGDPVALRAMSGLDGRTLMGERLNGTGFLVLSLDGGDTWVQAPPPYPDFSHLGQIECFVGADGAFIWYNGFGGGDGRGVYRAKAGATAWTRVLTEAQIQDVSVDLVSYDAMGHIVALWGRQSRTSWVVSQLG